MYLEDLKLLCKKNGLAHRETKYGLFIYFGGYKPRYNWETYFISNRDVRDNEYLIHSLECENNDKARNLITEINKKLEANK